MPKNAILFFEKIVKITKFWESRPGLKIEYRYRIALSMDQASTQNKYLQ